MERPEVVVPDVVWAEVNGKGEADPSALALRRASWIRPVAVPEIADPVLAWDLGPGESAVTPWALLHSGALVIIDDLAGRRCARSLGLTVRGTLGLVLRAHKRGMIQDARTALEEMRHRGMWLSDAIIERAMRELDSEP